MKTFEKFEINNIMHASILSYAVELAQNQTLENAEQYLKDRFEIAPLKALEAIYLYNLGYKLTGLQQRYIDAYTEAMNKHHNKFESVYFSDHEPDHSSDTNYPDGFDPDLYGL